MVGGIIWVTIRGWDVVNDWGWNSQGSVGVGLGEKLSCLFGGTRSVLLTGGRVDMNTLGVQVCRRFYCWIVEGFYVIRRRVAAITRGGYLCFSGGYIGAVAVVVVGIMGRMSIRPKTWVIAGVH